MVSQCRDFVIIRTMHLSFNYIYSLHCHINFVAIVCAHIMTCSFFLPYLLIYHYHEGWQSNGCQLWFSISSVWSFLWCSSGHTTHHLPSGRCRVGWSEPGQSCDWADWCKNAPLSFPGCSVGSAPSCCPSPPALLKLLLTQTSGLGQMFGQCRTSMSSARRGPSGRPAPSGL